MILNSLLSVVRPESAMVRILQARQEKSSGLELALQYASRRTGGRGLPDILIYPDTLPDARVAGGFFGGRTLLVSQGALSSFRDDEVVAVMSRGLELLSQRGIGIKTLCSACHMEFEKSLRQPWTPLRAVVLWTLLPFRNFFKRQDQKLNVFRATRQKDAMEDRAWRDALHKVSCSERIFS
jgi:hypothetical protein